MERSWHNCVQHLFMVDDWHAVQDFVIFSLFFPFRMLKLYMWEYRGVYNWFRQKGSFKDEVKDIVEVSTEDAYRMTMKSMVRWLKKNMDSNKSRVFFTSMSPSHYKWVYITYTTSPLFLSSLFLLFFKWEKYICRILWSYI